MTGTEDYVIVEAAVSDIFPSPSQPPGRAEMSTSLNALKNSIRDIGLQYPPLVVRKMDGQGFVLVDGHRRIKAMQQLAWRKIPVLVSQSGKPEELFSAVCGTTRPVSANQWVGVYLGGGMIPPGPTKTCITKLEDLVGREFLQKLLDAGLSPQLWNLANRVMRYLNLDDSQKKKVLWWLLDHKITRQVAAWISGANQPQQLRDALEQNRAP